MTDPVRDAWVTTLQSLAAQAESEAPEVSIVLWGAVAALLVHTEKDLVRHLTVFSRAQLEAIKGAMRSAGSVH
jgi:hypothetical protein